MADVTISVSREALTAAVDAILDFTLRYEFTTCRNLDTLTAECGGGCQDDLDFLKAARDAGVSIDERWQEIMEIHGGQDG